MDIPNVLGDTDLKGRGKIVIVKQKKETSKNYNHKLLKNCEGELFRSLNL